MNETVSHQNYPQALFYQAGVKAMHEKGKDPNRLSDTDVRLAGAKRIGKRVLAWTSAFALAGGGSAYIAANDKMWNLDQSLSQPVAKVEAEVDTGKLPASKLTELTVDTNTNTWNYAESVTSGTTPVGEVSGIMQAQDGDTVHVGDKLILQRSEIAPSIGTPVEKPVK